MGSKRKADLKFLDFIASEFSGNNVYVYESYVQNGKRVYKDANGFVKDAPNGTYMANGDIYIDLNAGMEGEGFVLNTFAHELTHHIRDWSPTKFKALADFLVKEYGKAGQSVDELVHARMARSNLDYDAAFEEVVADSMEKMFTDGNIMDKLTKLKAQDKGLLQRIKNFIDKWLSKIKEFYSAEGQYVTREGELAHQLERFEQLQQLFAEALADAGDSYRTAEKNASNEAPEGIDSTQDTRMFSERRTFKNGQNARGEFIADVLIDLADINSKWWTGVYNHAILGMSKTDDTEFRQFYQEILKRTQDMEEYGKTNQATIEDSFIVQDGKGKEYIYQVSLDGYLHGVVLAKTNKAKYVAALRRATKGGQKYGQSASNIKRRTRNARSNMGRAGSSNGGNNRSNGNLGSSGLGSGTPKSNNQGNNNRGASSNQGVQNQPKLKKSDRDSDGNQLSEAQQKYFKDSKVRLDEYGDYWYGEGKLVPVYHATNDEFTVFMKKYLGANVSANYPEYNATAYLGFWFNTSDTREKTYTSRIVKAYLNIKKPYDAGTLDNLAGEILRETPGSENPKRMAQAFVRSLKYKGYDGIIIRDEEMGGISFVAFESNQIKRVDNLSPTARKDIRHSNREGESISNRSLLANAFESMAQNDIEKQKIAEYKAKIETKEAEERKLRDLKEQIKELSFAKGPRDTAKLRSLREEAIKTANRLSIYDGQLLRLEASKPLQNVLLREKKKAYDRAKAEGKQAKLAAMEGRNKTAMRHKIPTVVGGLQQDILTTK